MRALASLRPLWREALLVYYRWAQREIHPLHPDMPHIVHAINRLEYERRTAAAA